MTSLDQPVTQPKSIASVSYDITAKIAITEREYRVFQSAYDFLNTELFSASLPHVLVTLQRHAKPKGYFAPNRFASRIEQGTAHELAMNPDVFTGRSDKLILSTLAHEMVHVWQQTYGKIPRRAYHDKQWAEKMKAIGLYPSTTGEQGGKETGQSVTHYIIEGGSYDEAYASSPQPAFNSTGNLSPSASSVRRRRQAKPSTPAAPAVRMHGPSREPYSSAELAMRKMRTGKSPSCGPRSKTTSRKRHERTTHHQHKRR